MEGKQRGSFIEASGIAKTGAGFLDTMHINVGPTVDTISLYDALSATGTPIFKMNVQALVAGVEDLKQVIAHLHFDTGLYCAFTGGADQIDYVNFSIR